MYGLFIYMYHKNQPNIGKYMVHHFPPTWILWPMGKGASKGTNLLPKIRSPKTASKLRHRTRQHFCFAQMCPIPSCTTSPGCCSRVRSRSWNVHDGYDISFMGYSHIQRLGGLYIQFQIQYGTTGYHWYKGIYAGCWPGLQGWWPKHDGNPGFYKCKPPVSLNKS